jgi:hypothetical protein
MEKTGSFREQGTTRKSRSSELLRRKICECGKMGKQNITEEKRIVSDVSVNLYIILNQKYRQILLLERHHLLDLGNRLTGVETLGACP